MLYADDFYLLIPFMLLNMGGYYLLLNSHYHLFEKHLFRRGLFLLITIITYALIQLKYFNLLFYYITLSTEISIGFIFSLSSIFIMILIFRNTLKYLYYLLFIMSSIILIILVEFIIYCNIENMPSNIGQHWIFQYLAINIISIIYMLKGYRIVPGIENEYIERINKSEHFSRLNDSPVSLCLIFIVFISLIFLWYISTYEWIRIIEYLLQGILFSFLMFFATMKILVEKNKNHHIYEIIIMSFIVGIICGILSHWNYIMSDYLNKLLSFKETLQNIWWDIKGWLHITLIHISLYIGLNFMIRANGFRLLKCTVGRQLQKHDRRKMKSGKRLGRNLSESDVDSLL